MKLSHRAALLVVGFSFSPVAFAQTFFPIKEPDCLTSVADKFTTGEQYIEGYPANGVLPDSYSILTRWQGNIAPLGYTMSTTTGFTPPSPLTSYQSGPQPEDASLRSPGNQYYCYEGAILLNTRTIRHRQVEGGGFNNMFGYSWSSGNMPQAFVSSGQASDLVVQIEASFPHLVRYVNAGNGSNRRKPILTVGLFAYLRDSSHPNLPDIAILGIVGATNHEWINPPRTDFVFSDGYATKGGMGYDYPTGVWFASGPIRTSTPFTTTHYVPQPAIELTSDFQNPGVGNQFYRMHISPKNIVQLVRAIDAQPCPIPPGCPPRGYSQNPADYRVAYAGLIAEANVLDFLDDPPLPFSYTINDPNKDQIEGGVKYRALGIYAYTPGSSFKTGTVSLTNHYYENILFRAPDVGGRDWWAATVLSQTTQPDAVQKSREMGSGFFQSAEYAARNTSDSQYVIDLYRALLFREPDAGGHAYWVGQVPQIGRYNVLLNFLYSAEYYSTTVSVLY